MRKKYKTIFIRESISKLEYIDIKRIAKKINKLKNKKLRNIVIKILKFIISVNFNINIFKQTIKENIFNDNILCIVPIGKLKNNYLNRVLQKKLIKKLNKIKDKNEIKYIVFSKRIKQNENLMSDLRKIQLNEYIGKNILKFMILDVIKYITNAKNQNLENQNIYILVNEYNKINIDLIENISRNVKCVYIITNQIRKFKIFEKNLYLNDEIMIVVTNNKEKSLKRAELIWNIDFNTEELSEYVINRNSIIINSKNSIIDMGKCFNGIIVNSVKIMDNIEQNIFDIDDIVENLIVDMKETKSVKEINNLLKDMNINISYLIGKRGKIEKIEYTKIA